VLSFVVFVLAHSRENCVFDPTGSLPSRSNPSPTTSNFHPFCTLRTLCTLVHARMSRKPLGINTIRTLAKTTEGVPSKSEHQAKLPPVSQTFRLSSLTPNSTNLQHRIPEPRLPQASSKSDELSHMESHRCTKPWGEGVPTLSLPDVQTFQVLRPSVSLHRCRSGKGLRAPSLRAFRWVVTWC
jgi:hypothetical protein